MCTDCGCSVTPLQAPQQHQHQHQRMLHLHTALLAQNDAGAALLRQRFEQAGVQVVNLLSSPGSGKTSLLEALASRCDPAAMAVIVGDLATDHDARRLQRTGVQAIQITTGQACHLEAAMLGAAVDALPLPELQLLVIENVGNLVCPTAYDLGETQRIVLLSVTEGEDKPLKYPATFYSADLVVISKSDLAAVVGFNRSLARQNIAQVAPDATVLEVSARTGAGMDDLMQQLRLGALQPR